MAEKKRSHKKKEAKSKPRKEAPRRARTPRLPGMEDAGIRELENLAEKYADVRDQRIALSKEEGTMQDDLLALMKKHHKVEYHHDEVHIWVKSVEMKVKVKLGEISTQRAEKESAETPKSFEETDEQDEEQDEPTPISA